MRLFDKVKNIPKESEINWFGPEDPKRKKEVGWLGEKEQNWLGEENSKRNMGLIDKVKDIPKEIRGLLLGLKKHNEYEIDGWGEE